MVESFKASEYIGNRHARWMVTGAAGFIGSHLIEALLKAKQEVIAVDNFATGKPSNIEDVLRHVGGVAPGKFNFFEADIRDRTEMLKLTKGVDVVLHQAALGSVPRSIKEPWTSHDVNVNGFLSILDAARLNGVRRFVYASSSSVYGDHPALPKIEENIGNVLSPYAATKRTNEVYARAYAVSYNMTAVGLRYFNVFGPRQDPNGQYAAVIPRWVKALQTGSDVQIFGDGETSRDFCYVNNVVQANIKSALELTLGEGRAYELNIAAHKKTTLNQLYELIRDGLANKMNSPDLKNKKPSYLDFRAGDIRHSLADIEKARITIGYRPTHSVLEGLAESLDWYVSQPIE